jgi:outer membrane protein assembly factor BamB
LEEAWLKRIVSGIFVVLLFASVSAGVFNIQLTKANASSLGETIQAAGADWWPMFHHDVNHTGTSTSTGPITNNTLWTYTTGNAVYSSPAIVDGFVYVGSYDKKVYCLSASNGTLVWSYTTILIVHSSPAVVDGRVYVGSGEYVTGGIVYCLNATTGTFIWSFTTGGEDARLSGVYSSPAIVDGLVYFGCNSGRVYCLNATTGAVFWWVRPSGTGYIISSPAIVGGLVYVGATDGWIYCINATDGSHVWSYHTGSNVYSSPAVVGGQLYVGSNDGKVYCLNAATGTHIWNYTTGNWVDSSPAVIDDLVYVGSGEGKVYCLNATSGTFVWSYTTGASVWASSPSIAGGLVYVGSNDTKLYCLNATTGSPIWSYETGGGVISSPVVVGVVYVGSADGNVYAFGEPTTVTISPSPVVMDVTQSQLFTSSVSGGTSPYSYQWFLNGIPVPDATSATWTFAPTSLGSYTIYVNVTDSVSTAVTSNIVTATVNVAPSASISPSSATFDVGQSKLFTSTVSDGTSPYTYKWYLNEVAVSDATNSTWTFTPNSSGSYNVYVNASDSANFTSKSNIASVTVNPSLSVTVSPSSVIMDVGQSQQFTSTVNGTSPYTYQWYLNGAPVSNATFNSWTFTPTSSDSYTLYLFVTDGAGEIAISPASNISVNPVIPEFQQLFFLPLFMMATLLFAILLMKKKHPNANKDLNRDR